MTPEEGWSYASFECNVSLSSTSAPHSRDIPDLGTLVRRVVGYLSPGAAHTYHVHIESSVGTTRQQRC